MEGMLLHFSVAYCLEELLADGFHIVMEATPEVLQIKQAVFREVAAILKHNDAPPDKVLLCSNTISIPMDRIATGVAYPCIALRFLHPVWFVGHVVAANEATPAFEAMLIDLKLARVCDLSHTQRGDDSRVLLWYRRRLDDGAPVLRDICVVTADLPEGYALVEAPPHCPVRIAVRVA